MDTGVSVDLSPASRWADIIGVAGAALDAAIAAVKDGEAVGAVGTAIGDLIDGRGYKPIYNLAGHGLGRWQLHSGFQIPNSAQRGGPRLRQGMIFAIEPFVTTGEGYVVDGGKAEVFMKSGEPTTVEQNYSPARLRPSTIGTACRWPGGTSGPSPASRSREH